MGLSQTLTISINGKKNSLEIDKLHSFHKLIVADSMPLVEGCVILTDEMVKYLMQSIKTEIFETRCAGVEMRHKYPQGFRLGEGPDAYHDVWKRTMQIEVLEEIIMFFKTNSPKTTDDVRVTYSFCC